MKKVIAITLLTVGLLAISCDRQKALDRILADPQMKSYMLSEMLKNEETKAQLADSIFADKVLTDQYLTKLVADEGARTDLFNRCLQADTSGNWIISKLAEDPNLKAKMKEASK
jgi:hypothetical protein